LYIDGTFDTSYTADYLSVPEGITWPEPMKKAISRYAESWQKWADAEAQLVTLLAEQLNAPSLDADLLREAVRQGKPDPGTPNQNRLDRAVAFSKELTRQTAATARAAADKLIQDLAPHRDALFSQAITIERGRLDTLRTAHADAQAAWRKADDDARSIGSTIAWLIHHLGHHEHLQYQVNYAPKTMSWPAPHSYTSLNRPLENLELTLQATKSAPEPTE
jgi:hypothetical protein